MSTAKRFPIVLLMLTAGLAAVASAARGDTLVASVDPIAPVAASKPVPARPTDPVKRAAFDMLDTHCARCHQTEKLVGRKKVAKNFDNILDLDGLAANKKYVRPGDPDESLILHTIVRQEMPYDVFQDGDVDHPAPQMAELNALRSWIQSLDTHKADQVAQQADPLSKMNVSSQKTTVMAYAASNQPFDSKPIDVIASKETQAKRDQIRKDQAGEIKVASLGQPGETLPAPVRNVRAPNADASVLVTLPQDLIREAQEKLRRLGCFRGTVNGIDDSETARAVARYNDKLGHHEAPTAVTASLVDELDGQTHEVCEAVCPKGQIASGRQCIAEPTVATVAPASHAPIQQQAEPVEEKPYSAPAKPKRQVRVARATEETEIAPHRPSHVDRPSPVRPPPAPKRTVQQERHVSPRVALRQPSAPSVSRERPSRSYGGGGGGGGGSDTISGVNGI